MDPCSTVESLLELYVLHGIEVNGRSISAGAALSFKLISPPRFSRLLRDDADSRLPTQLGAALKHVDAAQFTLPSFSLHPPKLCSSPRMLHRAHHVPKSPDCTHPIRLARAVSDAADAVSCVQSRFCCSRNRHPGIAVHGSSTLTFVPLSADCDPEETASGLHKEPVASTRHLLVRPSCR